MNAIELFNLTGRKALVTGAGRGIGRVMAISLAQIGCDIAILEKNVKDARNVAEEIKKLGRKAVAIKVDVTKKADVEKAFSAAAKQLGRLDIVINNAGVCIHEAAEDTPEEHYDFVVDTDMKGVFLCCQAAAALMKPQKKGSIINIASMSGSIANYPQKQAHYNAAKAGVILLTKCLAVEWVDYGIRVNSISPGYTRTEMTVKLSAPEMIAQWESMIPMRRMADPQELAGAAIYLASDASSYTTGSDIIVDGGYTAL
jgi:NAD(P)-dependent dehydrogenase (short-subunit alcohol dehydrogenase family)